MYNQRLIKCPHCGSYCNVLKTRLITPVCSEVTVQCRNVDCLHRYVAQISPVRTLVPSQRPRPDIHLPQARTLSEPVAKGGL